MADKAKDKKKAEASEKSGPLPDMSAPPAEKPGHHKKMDREVYEAELEKLQVELVKLQEWIKHAGLRVAVIFEGRDAAGKGGTIKRVTEHLNPRVVSIAALATPTERERTEWYFQRYVEHLPSAGEMVLFDRSWYNRPGVERVMGFCTEDEVWEFFRTCPEFERMIIRSGIILLKYWFSVSDEEQEKRFQARLKDPLKVWKLSPMDLREPHALGGVLAGQGRDVRLHGHQGLSLVGGQRRRQASRAAEHDPPSARPDPLPGRHAQGPEAGRPAAGQGLRAAADRQPDVRARDVLVSPARRRRPCPTR